MSLQNKLDQEYEANRNVHATTEGELLILRAMKRRLEEWAVELEANRDKPGDVGKFIAMELRNRMAGKAM